LQRATALDKLLAGESAEAQPSPEAARASMQGAATYVPRRQQAAAAAAALRQAVTSEAETIHRPIRASGFAAVR
jgi:hypothetical protein